MARNEAKLVARIRAYLNKLPESYCFKIKGDPRQTKGISDLMWCYKGKFITLEAKDPHNPKGPTKYQKLFMSRIEEAGGEAYVVRSVREVKKIVHDQEAEATS